MGSPMRPGNTAEAITPIIVALATANQPTSASGRAARSASCQEIDRSTSDSAIKTNASAIHPGFACSSVCPTRLRFRWDSAYTTSATTSTAPSSTAHRAARPAAIRRSAIFTHRWTRRLACKAHRRSCAADR